MPSDVEVDRALATVTATLNDHRLEQFDGSRVQAIVDEAIGGERRLFVDDGGGVHDDAGRRVGAIRRTPSGEWITDRQNPAADQSETAIPRG